MDLPNHLHCIIKSWSLTTPMCAGRGNSGRWHAKKKKKKVSWLISNHKPRADNPLDDHIDDYLKPCVRWLDKTDRRRPADGDALLVPLKYTVDTVTCYFTVIHLMKIQHTACSSQTTVCHSSQRFNSRMGLTCFALG